MIRKLLTVIAIRTVDFFFISPDKIVTKVRIENVDIFLLRELDAFAH